MHGIPHRRRSAGAGCTSPAGDGQDHDRLTPADKRQVLNRLATIEGHVRGIRRMVEEDVSCADVLRQTYAVRRALKAFESTLLEGRLASYVSSALLEGRGDALVHELGEVFEFART